MKQMTFDRRKFVKGLGVSLSALSLGSLCFFVTTNNHHIEKRLERITEVREVKDLCVNLDERVITICHKGHLEGINDIYQLIRTGAISEEAYCYIPKERVWVEIGLGASKLRRFERDKDSDSLRVTQNQAEGIRLSHEVIDIVLEHYPGSFFYHYHRRAEDVLGLVQGKIPDYSDKNRQTAIDDLLNRALNREWITKPQFILPSPSDVKTMAYLSFSEPTSMSRLISEYGITLYSLTQKSIDYANNYGIINLYEVLDSIIKNEMNIFITQMRGGFDSAKFTSLTRLVRIPHGSNYGYILTDDDYLKIYFVRNPRALFS